MEVFRYLVDAYLSGEVVSAGDILQLRARDNTASARLQAVYNSYGESELRDVRLRRYGTIAVFALAGLLLLALVTLGINERYFTTTATHAVVEAPTVRIRAPIVGRFVTALQDGQVVPPETLLGILNGLDGTVVSLESPCDCVVLEQVARNGQHYQAGEPLVVLIEAERPLMVRAQLPLEQVDDLEIGDRAEIRLRGESELLLGQIERIDLRPGREALRDEGGEAPIARRLAQVIVRPDRPFELDEFGTLVELRFP
jgi:alginate biosynthesis protein Alg44